MGHNDDETQILYADCPVLQMPVHRVDYFYTNGKIALQLNRLELQDIVLVH
ncbi:hypothetical protein JXA70_10250 [candidate division KSB1 bacterium]|nr:hypothetical protein [candidate division KSB1 bacterium]